MLWDKLDVSTMILKSVLGESQRNQKSKHIAGVLSKRKCMDTPGSEIIEEVVSPRKDGSRSEANLEFDLVLPLWVCWFKARVVRGKPSEHHMAREPTTLRLPSWKNICIAIARYA